MGFLKHLRSRSKLKNDEEDTHKHAHTHEGYGFKDENRAHDNDDYYPGATGRDCISALPTKVLQRIFTFVCPHTLDHSYEVCENVDLPDTCMLCDLRDLAHCAAVRRSWYDIAQKLLYTSVRIDPVHYCELEETLEMERGKHRRRSRHRSRNGGDDYVYSSENDPAAQRLQDLCETLRNSSWLSSLVLYMKLPYMVRETHKNHLARAVSVCPNLRYVDLPEGFFTGDANCGVLRQELLVNCPEIRKMKYLPGSEAWFQSLAGKNSWMHLEQLAIEGIKLDLSSFRIILARLPVLNSLTVTGVSNLSDDVFARSPNVPPFPPLRILELRKLPRITASGILTYLARPETREVLSELTLDGTGVKLSYLYKILLAATNLESLTVIQRVDAALPLEAPPAMASKSLKTLHYEIRDPDPDTEGPLPKPSDSYHRYLLSSLLSQSLPALRALYVRDPALPDALITSTLRAPAPRFLDGSSPLSSAQHRQLAGSFAQPLEVYTKDQHDDEWVFSPLNDHGVSGYATGAPSDTPSGRPVSSFNAMWGAEARRSVIIPNGAGGFLAIPDADMVRPKSSNGIGANARAGSGMSMSMGMGMGGGLAANAAAAGGAVAGNNHLLVPGQDPGVGHQRRRESWWEVHSGEGKRGSRADLWR